MQRSRSTFSLLSVFSVVALATVVACSESAGEACYPGDLRACSCADGTTGMQACAAPDSGTTDYGACNCTQAPDAAPSDAATTDAQTDAAPEAGLLPFMSACTMNSECETMLCFPFNAKGPHCTKPCTVASDCPPPSTGCSGMSVCKTP